MKQHGFYILVIMVFFSEIRGAVSYLPFEPHNVFTIIPEQYQASKSLGENHGRQVRPVNLRQFIEQVVNDQSSPKTMLSIARSKRNTQKIVTVYQGVQAVNTDRIIIISRGRNPAKEHLSWLEWFCCWPTAGGGVRKVHQLLMHNILPNTVFVCFDYNKPASPHDFGYTIEQSCISTVIHAVVQANPQARITLMGDCRAAHAALCYLATHPEQEAIDSLILESPFVDIGELIKHTGEQNLGFIGQPILQTLFDWYYPDYYTADLCRFQQDIPAFLGAIQGKKIFIGHWLPDPTISNKQIHMLVEGLTHKNEVCLFTTNNAAAGHSRLAPVADYQRALNAFCAQYGLSHDSVLAQAG